MANRLQFRYDIVENSMSNSTANGKWYARAKHAGIINLRGKWGLEILAAIISAAITALGTTSCMSYTGVI